MTQITQRDIDRVTARKARLEPLAKANGLTYDDGDEEQVDVLQALARLRERAEAKAARGAAASSAATPLDQAINALAAQRPGREPARSRDAASPANADFGDRVAAEMASRRGAR